MPLENIKFVSFILSGTMAAALFAVVANAADAGPGVLPAVSAVNGKIELGAGWANIDDLSSDALLRGGASLSFPLGDMFGIQADLAAVNIFSDTMVGGNLHFFARDPNSYLLGVVGGAGFSNDANVYYVGPEAELYLGNFSVEAWGGYMNIDFDNSSSENKGFAQVDLGLYATDDFRLTFGGSSIAGFESAHAGFEWQVNQVGLPISLTADAEFGEDSYTALSAGLKIYFGGEDKSLIRRHREDDPRNRSLDIFSGLGNAVQDNATSPLCPDGEVWNGEFCVWIDG